MNTNEKSSCSESGIYTLLAQYAHTLDSRNAEAFANLFTSRGCLVVNGKEQCGADALKAFVTSLPAEPRGKHMTINVAITSQDAAIVAVHSDFLLLRKSDNVWGVALAGSYDDQLACEGSSWKFRSRKINIE